MNFLLKIYRWVTRRCPDCLKRLDDDGDCTEECRRITKDLRDFHP